MKLRNFVLTTALSMSILSCGDSNDSKKPEAAEIDGTCNIEFSNFYNGAHKEFEISKINLQKARNEFTCNELERLNNFSTKVLNKFGGSFSCETLDVNNTLVTITGEKLKSIKSTSITQMNEKSCD